MKNVLILHGSGNNSKGNWVPWLKTELGTKRWKVWTPNLPDSNHPDIDTWKNTVFSNKDWAFNQKSVIIGHSAGVPLALAILQDLPKDIQIAKVILVAGLAKLTGDPQVDGVVENLFKEPFNWEKIKRSCKSFYFIHSDNDRYHCDVNQGKFMQQHLGGELIVREGENHFNLESSPKYKEFPFLLKLID